MQSWHSSNGTSSMHLLGCLNEATSTKSRTNFGSHPQKNSVNDSSKSYPSINQRTMSILGHCTFLESVSHLTAPLPKLTRGDTFDLLEIHLILVEHGLESLVDDLLDEFSERTSIIRILHERPKRTLEVMPVRRSITTRGLVSRFV